MRRRRRLAAAAAAVVVALASSCGGGVPDERLSLVLVTLDTARADRFGAYGGERVPTPNFDRIAGEGATFLDATSQVPLTLPAHSTILTGRYPATHGVRHNGIYHLPETAETLAEHLAARGFVTAGFVASYVLNRGFGIEQGFETFDDVPVNRFEGGRDQLFEAERSADEVNARVFDWLDRTDTRDTRVFLWVHYYDPHDPYDPPETPGRTLAGEGYDREISYVDHALGDLFERLRDAGLVDRSVVVVVGDHGESLEEHGERTHGLFVYEASLHVPFVVRAPGRVPSGARIDGPVELVDVAPTALELLGQDPLTEAQGRSLVAALDGDGGDVPEPAFAESLMPRLEFGWSELRAVKDGRFKYIEAPTPELYDLDHDPGELVNLAPNDPERVAELAALLAEWRASTEGGEPADEAAREISPEELARLQSLGYMQSGLADDAAGDERPDPKDRIAELRLLDDARDRLASGHPGEALLRVDGILQDNPWNHNARATRIAALIELGRLEEAEAEARAGLTLATTGPQPSASVAQKSRGLLAGSLQLQGRLEEAERVLREMIETDPTDEAPKVELARMWVDHGRPGDALEWLAPILRDDPRNGMALAARFRAEIALGRSDDALRTARRLADARAGDADTLVRAGDLLQRAGEPARAAAAFEVAQEQSDLDPALLGRLGTARIAEGDLDGAEGVFLAFAELRPADPRPYYYLGEIELRRGNEDAARRRFDEALQRDGTFVTGLVSLARWLREQGREAEARDVIEEARRRNPADPGLRRELDPTSR